MRVLVAGATGVIGRALVPLLTSVGHDVIGLSRSTGRSAFLEGAGARTVVADALDAAALDRAVREAAPDAVVHLLTAIPPRLNPRGMPRQFALTDRLRTEGTRNLIEAAHGAGARRVISQSVAFGYDPDGAGLANEDTPLWPTPPKPFRRSLDALRELERRTRDAGGLVLRFGHLYGPGTAFDTDGQFVRQIMGGKLPLVGGGSATFSFTHVHDAATAVVAALDKNTTGTLNIVDNDPARMSEWVPEVARILGAPAPKRLPVFIARLAVGGWGTAYMTRLRGADNARARLSLDWRPRHTSWRTGLAVELNGAVAAAK
ncbi:NAD-dependent epimerase/dehydratase family protein [Streptomyces sp. NPDC058301]|uniref:NAD-dependent epimerase/dehydratase family protein n=1 Tax=Streptomyces sp. NPDC058301 TaxID=3346436 RepID=UPI0036EFF762